MEDFKNVVMENWKYALVESIRKEVPISKDKIRELFKVVEEQKNESYQQGVKDTERKYNPRSTSVAA